MNPPQPIAAVVQLSSGPDIAANLDQARRQLEAAARAGAVLAVLPENFGFLGRECSDVVDVCESDGSGPLQEFLHQQSRRLGIWIIGGTVPLATDDPTRVRAACLVIDDRGERVARYDKIHLFDVELPGNAERYLESEAIEPGDTPVALDTPVGRIGLSVCYDLRFPELYRELVDRKIELIAVPAAFTAVTGKAHWEVLLRARAIENSCYVLAAGQVGRHPGGRETHGHSMIADSWGKVLGCRETDPGIVHAPIDLALLHSTRRSFPCLEHRQTGTRP